MKQQLDSVLQQSETFHHDLDELWSGTSMPQAHRARVVVGYCSIVREHVLSQQHLLALGFDVTAMTLVRPAFEALVRGIWSMEGASDEWIEKFLSPPAAGTEINGETIKGPPVDSMLDTISKHHPVFVHESLQALKDGTWLPMHSYVHGGIRPVLQALMGCPEPQQIAVVLNGNGFALFATNVMLIACGGPSGILAQIQHRYRACLPPMTPVGPTEVDLAP